jgi:two-component system response regulator
VYAPVILLVEDNPSDVELAQTAFKEIGCLLPIVVAPDGAEALDYLLATGRYKNRDAVETPLLVLLDLKLPKISGLDVLKRIRSHPRLKGLIVIVLTSSDEESDKIEAERLGINFYSCKPVDYDEFLAFARRVHALVSHAR